MGNLNSEVKRIAWWFTWFFILFVGCDSEPEGARKLFSVTDARSDAMAIAFSPDNQTFAFITQDNQVQLRDLSKNKVLQTLYYNNIDQAVNLSFSPDGSQLAVSTIRVVDVWDIENNQLQKSFLVDDLYPYGAKRMAFSHDGLLLALNAGDTLRIWDIRTGEIITDTELEHYRHYAGHIIFSPKDDLIALFTGYLHIWDLESEALIASTPNGSDSFSFTADGMELVSIKRNDVFRWRMPNGELIDKFTIDNRLPLLAVLPPDAKEVIEFSYGRYNLENQDTQNETFEFNISLWNVEDGELLWRMVTDDVEFSNLGYLVASPTGDHVAMIGLGIVDIWQIK